MEFTELKFEHQEVYQIQIGSVSSLYQYCGYRIDSMMHSFYDLRYGTGNRIFLLPVENIHSGEAIVTHKPNLKQFYI